MVKFGLQVMACQVAKYVPCAAQREARTQTIPSQIGHPRGQRGRKCGHTERKTIPEARDSIGFPDVSLRCYGR
jgi:hypothetical protein